MQKYKTKQIITILSLGVILTLILASPVFAIIDPTDILFGCETDVNVYRVFQNVSVDGDMLFVAETYVHYLVTPTDYTSAEAFTFDILDTDGVTVLYTTPLLSGSYDTAFEDYVNSIYLTPAQASTLTWEAAYSVRIAGNPAIFGGLAEGSNKRTHVLQAANDYISDTPSGISLTALRIFMLKIAHNLEVHDGLPAGSEYIINIQGIEYLTLLGGQLFLRGVPGLNDFVPSLFQGTSGAIVVDQLEPTGAYAETLTPTNQLGQVIGDGVVNFGIWMGFGTKMAGAVILLLITIIICGYAYVKSRSMLVPDAIAICMPLLGAYLGLIDIAIGFVATIAIVLISSYYFFTRGAL